MQLVNLIMVISHRNILKQVPKKVLLTGPSKGGHVQMVVKGVNDDQLDIEAFDIFSNASCTTNCIDQLQKF